MASVWIRKPATNKCAAYPFQKTPNSRKYRKSSLSWHHVVGPHVYRESEGCLPQYYTIPKVAKLWVVIHSSSLSFNKRLLENSGWLCLCDCSNYYGPVGWGCTIHRQYLYRRLRLLQRVSCIWYKTIWRQGAGKAGALGECGVPLPYHRSQVYSDPKW